MELKLTDAFKNYSKQKLERIAQRIALDEKLVWKDGLKYIFDALINDPGLVPSQLGAKKDTLDKVIEKWIQRYSNGYQNRASQRNSNLPSTVPDPIIKKILENRFSFSKNQLQSIEDAHQLAMSVENIQELILEEFLSIKLKRSGWYCAWGETIRSVDFVNKNGDLLQVKNRSNSENSSSSSVRKNTKIKKWYRIEATEVKYRWNDLNHICGTNLSESDFVSYAHNVIKKNPNLLAITPQNTWNIS